MKKKLLAIVLACLILVLAITAGTATRRYQAAEDRLARASDEIAGWVTRRLSQIPFSYEELVALAQEKGSSYKTLWDISAAERDLDFFEDVYPPDDGRVSGGILQIGGMESYYIRVREILEKEGPSEELEKLYEQLEPYCRLLFEWEIKEYPYGQVYADADAMAQRLLEICEADFNVSGNEIKKGIDKLWDKLWDEAVD